MKLLKSPQTVQSPSFFLTVQVTENYFKLKKFEFEDSDPNSQEKCQFLVQSCASEVLTEIFVHLGLKSLCRVSGVCKLWREIASQSRIWQNICQKYSFYFRYEDRHLLDKVPNFLVAKKLVQLENDVMLESIQDLQLESSLKNSKNFQILTKILESKLNTNHNNVYFQTWKALCN